MDSKGVTLLECLVAVGLLGFITAIASVQTTRSMDIAKAKSEAERVRAALLQARDLARMGISCVTVNIDQHSMLLTPYKTCDSTGLANPQATTSIQFDPHIILQRTDGLTNTQPLLTFNTFGGTQETAPTRLIVKSDNQPLMYSYVVMPAIGTVRIE